MVSLLFLLFLFGSADCCSRNDASLSTAQVVSDMKETIRKSKEFVRTMDSTLLEFALDLETKMTTGSRQLEKIINHGHSAEGTHCSHAIDRRAVCDYEKECPAHMNTSLTCTNSEGTEKPSVRQRKSSTTRTEWSGPANSCARIYNDVNATKYINISNYPSNVAEETFLKDNADPKREFNDRVVRMDVRDGCMVTLYQHFFDKYPKKSKYSPERRILKNIEYGSYDVQSKATGTAEGGYLINGVSRVECMCDPLRTKPEQKKQRREDCVTHHLWNEETQRCEWILADDICGETTTITTLNKVAFPRRLRIPNWPLNKRYDVNLKLLSKNDEAIASITVRNGCFATMYAGDKLNSNKTLATRGYGIHNVEKRTTRIVCECLNDDSENEQFVVKAPGPPECIIGHFFNTSTGSCEWLSTGCLELYDNEGDAFLKSIANLSEKVYTETDFLHDKKENNKYNKAVVRKGCMATFWSSSNESSQDFENKILVNVEYGEYEIEAKSMGTVAAGETENGLSRVSCICDPTQVLHQRAPKDIPCQPNHVYDDKTGHCEWTLEKNICGEAIASDGERMFLRIPNWPLNKRYDVNFVDAKLTSFKVASIIVRQHCFATLFSGASLKSDNTLNTTGYGHHNVGKIGTERVVCECMY